MRSPRIKRRRTAGLSLVEVIIGISLLGVIAGVMVLATETTTKSMRSGSMLSELDMLGTSVIDRIAVRVAQATRDDVVPASPAAEAPFHTTRLDYQPTEFVGGAPALGNLARIGFEYAPGEADDGIDNDGNGLVDEGQIVLTEDLGLASERRIVLCRWVGETQERETAGNGVDDNGNGLRDEGGLAFDFVGDRVNVRLTLQRLDPDGFLVSRSFGRTIAFRK